MGHEAKEKRQKDTTNPPKPAKSKTKKATAVPKSGLISKRAVSNYAQSVSAPSVVNTMQSCKPGAPEVPSIETLAWWHDKVYEYHRFAWAERPPQLIPPSGKVSRPGVGWMSPSPEPETRASSPPPSPVSEKNQNLAKEVKNDLRKEHGPRVAELKETLRGKPKRVVEWMPDQVNATFNAELAPRLEEKGLGARFVDRYVRKSSPGFKREEVVPEEEEVKPIKRKATATHLTGAPKGKGGRKKGAAAKEETQPAAAAAAPKAPKKGTPKKEEVKQEPKPADIPLQSIEPRATDRRGGALVGSTAQAAQMYRMQAREGIRAQLATMGNPSEEEQRAVERYWAGLLAANVRRVETERVRKGVRGGGE